MGESLVVRKGSNDGFSLDKLIHYVSGSEAAYNKGFVTRDGINISEAGGNGYAYYVDLSGSGILIAFGTGTGSAAQDLIINGIEFGVTMHSRAQYFYGTFSCKNNIITLTPYSSTTEGDYLGIAVEVEVDDPTQVPIGVINYCGGLAITLIKD